DYLWVLYKDSKKIKKNIIKFIIGLADKGIILSSVLKRNLQPFLSDEKIYELPNFISNSLLEHDIEKTISNQKDQKLKILFLSNLIKEKGIIDFLEAMLILENKNIDFEVHIAGDIPAFMEKEIQKYFEKLNSILHYHGVVKGKQKKDLLLSSHIFVFPTLQEAQGIVLLEAMATANIILSTHVGGISDIFKTNKNGFTIDTHNPKQIADKISKIQSERISYNKMLIENYFEVKKKYTEKIFFGNLYKILMD
ncbi:glycosyltransferase family 4 protein, partial [Sulfurovum riftiae]